MLIIYQVQTIDTAYGIHGIHGVDTAHEVAVRLGVELRDSLLTLFVLSYRPPSPSVSSLVTRPSVNTTEGDVCDGALSPISTLGLTELSTHFSERGHDIDPLLLSDAHLTSRKCF